MDEDVSLLVDYRIEFLKDFGDSSFEKEEALRKNLKRLYESYLSNQQYVSFLAYENENLAGIGGMLLREQPGNFKNPEGRTGYIMNMYTVPQYRRRGICSEILRRLLEYGEKSGIHTFELHATKDGQPVYIKHGFMFHPEPVLRKYLSEN